MSAAAAVGDEDEREFGEYVEYSGGGEFLEEADGVGGGASSEDENEE